MPIRVKCGNCKKTLSVKDHLAGKKIKCPLCQTVVAVPSAAAPAASAAPSASPKKPPVAGKPVAKAKPPADATKTTGRPPPAAPPASNGTPAPEPIIELPPESIESEAASAFADEPKPAEEAAEPQFVEFKCDWCDENVKLPIEMAGKQAQCPNPECKRVVKVPLLKKAEKKDWKKMDQIGPAGAIINQPEALADAWGTMQATKAKQSSLAQAGVIQQPVKRPVGVIGWMFRAFYAACLLAVVAAMIVGGARLYSTKQQHNALQEAERLVDRKDPKIKHPLLKAQAHRTIALLYLREGKALKAKNEFTAALSYVEDPTDKNPAINDQLFLIDVALAQIKLGGTESEFIAKTKLEWKDAEQQMGATLGKIRPAEVRVAAMREVGTRLLERKQPLAAIGLSAQLANSSDPKKPAAFRQQIALLCAMPNQEEMVKKIATRPGPATAKDDAHARVGYAEGDARKGDYDSALALAKADGPARDRFDAHLGIGAVALQNRDKDRAAACVKEALALARDKDIKDWHHLMLVKLAARTDNADSVKDIINAMAPAFKLRAQLEIFLAVCERSPDLVPVDALQDLETADKEGTTLALAWQALAEHNAHKGASREKNRAIFEERATALSPELAEKVRPLVDVGTYLGSMK